VVVSFLEGDPDRPLVTGRVYNGENTTAMSLPDNKTQSAIRDHSGNEIVMEGKSGSEDIRINATKDTNVVITHDYNETVKTGDRTIAINSGTHTETIKGDTKVTVVSGSYVHSVAANTADRISKQTSTLISTAANVYVDAATNIQLHVGNSMLWMDSGGHIHLKATRITLEGSANIELMAPTIEAVGKDKVQAGVGGQTVTCDPAKVTVSGSSINSSASGVHEITGGVVKIN
jgi:type VI secretion system secreted protein VgrG